MYLFDEEGPSRQLRVSAMTGYALEKGAVKANERAKIANCMMLLSCANFCLFLLICSEIFYFAFNLL